MPQTIILPRQFAVIWLAFLEKDVAGFVVQVPEHLLMEV